MIGLVKGMDNINPRPQLAMISGMEHIQASRTEGEVNRTESWPRRKVDKMGMWMIEAGDTVPVMRPCKSWWAPASASEVRVQYVFTPSRAQCFLKYPKLRKLSIATEEVDLIWWARIRWQHLSASVGKVRNRKGSPRHKGDGSMKWMSLSRPLEWTDRPVDHCGVTPNL
jgi:hypothetical protein